MLTTTLIWVWRVLVMCRKEFVQFFRNWILALFLAYTFTMMTYHNATSISKELKNASLVVIDNDRSAASRELVYRFHEPQFRFTEELSSERAGIKQLDSGQAAVLLDIPEQFDRDIREGRQVRVQVQLDGADASRAYLTATYAGNIVQQFSSEASLRRTGDSAEQMQMLPLVENEQRVWFSPNHEETLFNAIQEVAQHVLLFSLLLPAAALAREKERGTVEQLLVSPLSPLQIMLGKILPMTAIILLASMVSLFVVIEGVLELKLRGSIVLFLAVTALFSSSAAGLGILIASFTRNIGQVGIVSITLMPIMLMLSGSDTPAEMMPQALLPIMIMSPLHHYLNAAFGILIKGAPLWMVWDSILWMALLGGCVFAVSLLRFRRSFR
jgi:ABC-2 type transport system permease protein